jgi:aminoglycoside phosphotransferase (APT) family kinase protein
MDLAERVVGHVESMLGVPVRVVDTMVDHHERCVLDVVLPDGRPAVVKGDLDLERAAREALVLAATRGAGVPVPGVIASAVDGAPGVLVLERVGGEWLAPERSAVAWRAAGTVLRALHDTAVPGLRELAGQRDWASGMRWMITYFERRCREAGLSADVMTEVRSAVDGLAGECPAGLLGATIHGDCMPIHVHLDGEDRVVGLLDLGEASRGDPAWDLVVLTLRSPARLRAVLDGYGADDRLRARVDRAFPTYRACRLVIEAGWLAEHGFEAAETARAATESASALSA